jgi:hypothetical protein
VGNSITIPRFFRHSPLATRHSPLATRHSPLQIHFLSVTIKDVILEQGRTGGSFNAELDLILLTPGFRDVFEESAIEISLNHRVYHDFDLLVCVFFGKKTNVVFDFFGEEQ